MSSVSGGGIFLLKAMAGVSSTVVSRDMCGRSWLHYCMNLAMGPFSMRGGLIGQALPGYVFEQTRLVLQLTTYTLQFAIDLRVCNPAQYVLHAKILQASFEFGHTFALLFGLGGVELAATVNQYGLWLAMLGYGWIESLKYNADFLVCTLPRFLVCHAPSGLLPLKCASKVGLLLAGSPPTSVAAEPDKEDAPHMDDSERIPIWHTRRISL